MGSGSRKAALGRLTFRLRRAIEADLEHIVRIENASFVDPWGASDFRSVLEVPQAIFLVAVDEASGVIAGYVLTMALYEDSEVLNIAVDLPFRRAALGAKLLDATLDEANRRGATMTFLEVRESNDAARRLYRSRGFEEISRRKNYYRDPVEDALVLRRSSKMMM